VEIVQRPDVKPLDDIFGLFWQTDEKSATKFVRREKVTGEMIAFMLCFDMGERLINASPAWITAARRNGCFISAYGTPRSIVL
jgi:hypothetical protein